MNRDIILDRLANRVSHHGNEPAYFSWVGGKWLAITWQEYQQKIRLFARALISLGIKADDKVAILGYNSLEWCIAALGTQSIRGVSVGIYTTSSQEEVSYVINHSDSRVLVVENLARYRSQVEKYKKEFTNIEKIIIMSEEKVTDDKLINFRDFLNLGNKISADKFDELFSSISAQDIATFIYTSGTTGNPKAVMLSHNSVAWTVKTAVRCWRVGSWDKSISYLPLAHVAEQMLTLYAPIESGLRCYFASSFENFKRDLKSVEPTVLFGVPRVYEKIHEAICAKLQERGKFSQKLIKYCTKISRDFHMARHEGSMPGIMTNIQYRIMKKKLFSPIREKIGLRKARLCLSGAAPISTSILEFFLGLDIPIFEVYGQSENSGPATCNIEGQTVVGSVGRAIPGGEIKIANDGEVLIKGPHVFSGYYKNSDASKEVLRDNWLYSGDVGRLDPNGYLYITDRKKDILITAGGKNISPQNIESLLIRLPYVQSAVVVGDKRKYLCALLAPDLAKIKTKAKSMGLEEDKIFEHDSVLGEIRTELEKLNQKLAPAEQIKKIKLLDQEFSVESGEFTPTLKVKRKFVNQKYINNIENMYR